MEKRREKSPENDFNVYYDVPMQEENVASNPSLRKVLKSTDFGIKKFETVGVPEIDCIRFAVPKNINYDELSFLLEKANFESQSEILRYKTVTTIIHQRTQLLQEYHESKQSNKIDASAFKKFGELYEKIEEKLLEQYNVCSHD